MTYCIWGEGGDDGVGVDEGGLGKGSWGLGLLANLHPHFPAEPYMRIPVCDWQPLLSLWNLQERAETPFFLLIYLFIFIFFHGLFLGRLHAMERERERERESVCVRGWGVGGGVGGREGRG